MENVNQLYFMTLRGQSEYGANLIMESLMLVGIDSTCSFGYDVATEPMDMDSLAYLVGMVNKKRVQFSIVSMEDAGD